MLCSIAKAICEKGQFASVIRLLTGVILIVSILKPVLPLDLQAIDFDFRDLIAEKEEIIQQGTMYASASSAGIISERINAYVAEKAAQYGADVQVDTVICDGIPTEISLDGIASPYAKSQIVSWIEQEIGIGREAVNWR